MIPWQFRPTEVANLLNPPFCGILLREFVIAYEDERRQGVPYELVFLVLPIVLHKSTREALPRTLRTQMHVWLQQNPNVRVQFAYRTKELTPFTKEALIFLMQRQFLTLNSQGLLATGSGKYKLTIGTRTGEIYDCIKKAKFVGKWFAQAGSSSTIYTMWGICP
jgi:hypothetical protein